MFDKVELVELAESVKSHSEIEFHRLIEFQQIYGSDSFQVKKQRRLWRLCDEIFDLLSEIERLTLDVDV